MIVVLCYSTILIGLVNLGYMKEVKAKLKEKGASEEEIKDFETKAQGFAKKIVANFKDYEFYIGESMDPDGMFVLLLFLSLLLLCLSVYLSVSFSSHVHQSPPDLVSAMYTDWAVQGYPPQLPRGRCHPLHHRVEARPHRDEGLKWPHRSESSLFALLRIAS